jgi:hypothetical protein
MSWPALLREWNDLLRACEETAGDVAGREWLGAPGASEGELRAAEARLGLTRPGLRLPESYRDFLACSNGWALAGPGTVCGGALRPAATIDRFAREHADWIAAYAGPIGDQDPSPAEHAVYGPSQDPAGFRRAYLGECLQVGEVQEGGVYLLNPAVVHDGEWEAWHLADWLPGATRHRSFRELVEALVAQVRGG